jgi:cytoskeletal protein RodZ
VQELGELLREARLEKGMSLEEVENLTKIRKRYLQAIEEGDYKVLPGPFYVRAFVKSYADTVGLDSEQVLRIYRNSIPDLDTKTQPEGYPSKRRRKSINTEKWSKVTSTFVFLCFMIVIVAVIYYYYWNHQDARKNYDESVPITQSEDYSTVGDDNVADQTPVVEPKQPNPQPQPEPEPELEPVLAKVGTENGTDIYVLKNADKIFVRMESENADCWYAVYDGGRREGKQIDTGTIKAGESKNYEFEAIGHFHLGFAKTIKLTVNGIEFKPSEFQGSFHVRIELEQPSV